MVKIYSHFIDLCYHEPTLSITMGLQTLHDLGLNDTEKALYMALLPLGSASASVLGKKIGIERTTARHACHQLEQKGFVSSSYKGNTILFRAEPLEKLHALIDQERKQLDRKEEKVKILISDLSEMLNPDIASGKWIKIYEGLEGVKRVFEDTLQMRETIYAFENENVFSMKIADYLGGYYRPKRIEQQIFAYVISPDTALNRSVPDEINYRETRFFVPEGFPFDADINIYGNKVGFFSYRDEHMFGAVIESAAIANTMKCLFDFFWKASSP